MTIIAQMKLFFEPKSVAILGVSRKTGPGAFNIVECLQLHGYQGKVYPVNPNAREIRGVRCYPSVEDIREPIDMWTSVMKFGAKPMYKTYLETLLQDEAVDAVFAVILSPKLPGQEFFDVFEEIIEAATRFSTKPIVVWSYGPDLEKITGKLDASGRVIILSSAERAIQLLYALLQRQRFSAEGKFS
jgi:acyl-CoA synthetase (NDP forming)